MKKNKKLLIGAIFILVGGTFMRLAWLIINEPISVAIIITGAILFLGGVIYFANAFFNRR